MFSILNLRFIKHTLNNIKTKGGFKLYLHKNYMFFETIWNFIIEQRKENFFKEKTISIQKKKVVYLIFILIKILKSNMKEIMMIK